MPDFKRKDGIRIGTWNVRGLNITGKTTNVIREMERLDCNILDVSETFWKGQTEFTTTLALDGKIEGRGQGEEDEDSGLMI